MYTGLHILGVYSPRGSSNRVDVDIVVHVSEVHAASIFKVEMNVFLV
jgi:hypothetical protein